MPTERRKHPRRKPDPGVKIACMSAAALGSGSTTVSTNVAVKLLDLSDKGAGLVTRGRLRAGAELLVRIFVEGSDDLYVAMAVVRWAETWSRDGREADVAGIEFMQVVDVRGRRFLPMASWATGLSTPQTERRRRKRRLLETTRVRCVTAGLFNALGLASNIGASLVDLSEGGCQIVATKKLEPGTRVRVTLGFQNPNVEIDAPADVRWANRDTLSLEPRYATGLAFGALSNDQEGRLLMILREMDAPER